jgi:putative ABC transport system permease protein
LLTLYGFDLLHGDAQTALDSPNLIVITSGKAIKYFGKTDVVGQKLALTSNKGGKQDFVVSGVLKPLPNNTNKSGKYGQPDIYLHGKYAFLSGHRHKRMV